MQDFRSEGGHMAGQLARRTESADSSHTLLTSKYPTPEMKHLEWFEERAHSQTTTFLALVSSTLDFLGVSLLLKSSAIYIPIRPTQICEFPMVYAV